MMRQAICAVMIATGGAAALSAQERHPIVAERRPLDVEKAQIAGQLRSAVQMCTTTGAPYSAEATTEIVQALSDGNRIARKTVVRIYRDSEGRVRRENIGADGAGVQSVTIVDPVSSTHILLEPDTRTAHSEGRKFLSFSSRRDRRVARGERKRTMEGEVRRRSETAMPPPPPPAPGAGRMRMAPPDGSSDPPRVENLGQRTFGGVSAQGTRTTRVIAAGAMGNEQPLRIVSEEWFSPDLQILLHTRHADPRSGETTYTLSNIVRAEPDRSLFEVPADYTRK